MATEAKNEIFLKHIVLNPIWDQTKLPPSKLIGEAV
jgi:hypothetical protein